MNNSNQNHDVSEQFSELLVWMLNILVEAKVPFDFGKLDYFSGNHFLLC